MPDAAAGHVAVTPCAVVAAAALAHTACRQTAVILAAQPAAGLVWEWHNEVQQTADAAVSVAGMAVRLVADSEASEHLQM